MFSLVILKTPLYNYRKKKKDPSVNQRLPLIAKGDAHMKAAPRKSGVNEEESKKERVFKSSE